MPSSSPPRSPDEPAREPQPALKKSLGQHHLRSGDSCRPLLDALRPAGQFVVEVGPGGGVLTRELLAAGARVLALELDSGWAAKLRERLDVPELEVRVQDALDFDWAGLPEGTLVAGNLPYNVGTAIVGKVLSARRPGSRAAFLLQREVVDRLVARVGDAAYGALSIRTELRADARRLGIVRPGAFVPPPKVDSAFVLLVSRAAPFGLERAEVDAFERWVLEAFGQRRKTLANSLAARHAKSAVSRALEASGRSPTIRAEELSMADLFAIYARLNGAAAQDGRNPGGTISDRENDEEN